MERNGMRRWTGMLLGLLALAVFLPVQAGADEPEPRALAYNEATNDALVAGDAEIKPGQFADTYRFEATAGQRLEILLRSSAFDTYLIVRTPSGEEIKNDDFGGTRASRVEIPSAEVGTYLIEVTSYGAGESGAYRIRVGDGSAEAGPSFEGGEGIDLGGTVAGELADGDPVLSGGEYYDLYRFEGRAGQRVTIDMVSDAFDAYLILLVPDRDSVENDDSRGTSNSQIVATLPVDGTYRIVATSYETGESGAYRFSVSERMASLPEAAGIFDAPGLDAEPVETAGTFDDRTAVLPSGNPVAVYRIRGGNGVSAAVEMLADAEGLDVHLTVIAPSGEEWVNDDFRGSTDSRVHVTFTEAGEYTVIASTYGIDARGGYRLRVTPFRLPKPSAALEASRPIDSGLREGGARFADRPVEVFGLVAEAGSEVTIRLSSEAFDPYLIVVTPSGRFLEDDDSGGDTNALLTFGVEEAGEYRILATSYAADASGAFRLVASIFGEGEPIAVGVTEGRLEGGDRILAEGQFGDDYAFTGRQGQEVTFLLQSTEIDPYLVVTPPSGEPTGNDDAEPGTFASRITMTLPADGTYRVTASSYGAGEEGAYELRVHDGILEGMRDLGRITEETRIQGSLEGHDLRLRSGEFRDQYRFRGEAGERVRIHLNSDAFDPYLIFFPPEGEQTDNDDAVEGDLNNSIIEATLPVSGEYRIMVTSFAGGEAGAYSLTVSPGGRRMDKDGGRRDDGMLKDGGRAYEGTLEPGDVELQSGEYYDLYTFNGRPGETVRIRMTSTDFDTYLILTTPDGEQVDVDDSPGMGTDCTIERVLSVEGRYTVRGTSALPAAGGRYALTIELSGGGDTGGTAGRQVHRGTLAAGDATLAQGEYHDVYTFEGRAGQRIGITLTSTDFDAYLVMVPPSGNANAVENDDGEGMGTNSRIDATLSESGTYQVWATSLNGGETGAYELTMEGVGGGGGTDPGDTGTAETVRGTLAAGDETLSQGEYHDVYTFEGTPGQRVRITLTSTDFDAYLVLMPPSGNPQEAVENDDGPDMGTDSRVDATLSEGGTYQVWATSLRGGETGAYELTLELSGEGGGVSQGGASEQAGTLAASDETLSQGEYHDVYTFEGRAGQQVQIDLVSTDFDAYLVLMPPSGNAQEAVENDDGPDMGTDSRITTRLTQTGTYQIWATSLRGGETGDYRFRLDLGGGSGRGPGGAAVRGGSRRVWGIFCGISDYPDAMNRIGWGDLPLCRSDAEKLYEDLVGLGFLSPERGELLVDGQCTLQAVRDAFKRIGPQLGENDVFIFFFSGHGGGGEHRYGTDPTEADLTSETLALADGELIDDEMRALFDGINAKLSILALDSCFSGGFAKDVIVRPGRIGLFSSEEDTTSLVAGKFAAGGYLSFFFRNALRGEADLDRNGSIAIGEMSHYLGEKFEEVDEIVMASGGSEMTYQRLVIDRGGVRVHELLLDGY